MNAFTKLLFVFTLFIVVPSASSQNTPNKFIDFKYHHSMRIPYNSVNIRIEEEIDSAIVIVNSQPMNNKKEWRYSNIQKQYKLSTKEFEELWLKTNKLKMLTLPEDVGFDGFTCAIEYGTKSSHSFVKVWSPQYKEAEPDLNFFVELCNEILIIGNLDPHEIFVTKHLRR